MWCYLPETACPSVQAAADLTWVLNLPSLALPPPALSNGRNTRDKPSSPHSAPDTSPQHPSGIISKHLTAGRGGGLLIPSLPDTHASRFPKRDSAKAQTIHGTFGHTSPASSAKSNRDGCSSKTSQDTFPLVLRPCCENYGIWATRLRLAHSQRLKLAQRTSASDGSAWPTATVSTGSQTVENPTPRQTGGTSLSGAAEAQNWPTPMAQNHKGSSPDSVTRADGKSRMDMLHYAAEQGFSHPVPATPQHGPTLSQILRIWRPLRASVIATHKRATWRRLMRSNAKRRLNPLFVEWLMGWPPGHALCDCSETEFVQFQQRMRGALSVMPTAYGPWIWKPPETTPEPTQMEMF